MSQILITDIHRTYQGNVVLPVMTKEAAAQKAAAREEAARKAAAELASAQDWDLLLKIDQSMPYKANQADPIFARYSRLWASLFTTGEKMDA